MVTKTQVKNFGKVIAPGALTSLETFLVSNLAVPQIGDWLDNVGQHLPAWANPQVWYIAGTGLITTVATYISEKCKKDARGNKLNPQGLAQPTLQGTETGYSALVGDLSGRLVGGAIGAPFGLTAPVSIVGGLAGQVAAGAASFYDKLKMKYVKAAGIVAATVSTILAGAHIIDNAMDNAVDHATTHTFYGNADPINNTGVHGHNGDTYIQSNGAAWHMEKGKWVQTQKAIPTQPAGPTELQTLYKTYMDKAKANLADVPGVLKDIDANHSKATPANVSYLQNLVDKVDPAVDHLWIGDQQAYIQNKLGITNKTSLYTIPNLENITQDADAYAAAAVKCRDMTADKILNATGSERTNDLAFLAKAHAAYPWLANQYNRSMSEDFTDNVLKSGMSQADKDAVLSLSNFDARSIQIIKTADGNAFMQGYAKDGSLITKTGSEGAYKISSAGYDTMEKL